MTPKEFYNKYFIFAKESERTTGVPALFTLAQAALESGWGAHVSGNNFFGIKDIDGINGNEILIGTTEYIKGRKYSIKAWFRKYKTPDESFTDHGLFLKRNKRYAPAFLQSKNPLQFAKQVAAAGYATDPNYEWKLINVMNKFI